MSALIARDRPSAGSAEFPVVDPDDLAEQYWGMCAKRDRIEQRHPQLAAVFS